MLPLSAQQYRFLQLHSTHPSGGASNLCYSFGFSEDVDLDRFHAAVYHVCRRHEIMRFRLVDISRLPSQDFYSDPPEIHIIHTKSSVDELDHLLRRERAYQFDLCGEPATRLFIVVTGTSPSAFIVNQHHIVSDGWSIGLLIQEITNYYFQLATIGNLSPEDQAPRYSTYVAWQKELNSQPSFHKQLKFWRDQMSGASTHSFGLSSEASELHLCARVVRHLGHSRSVALQSRARKYQCTIFSYLMGLFFVLISDMSPESEIVVGTRFANRKNLKFARTLGCFSTYLVAKQRPLHTDYLPGFIRNVQSQVFRMWGNSDVTVEQIADVCTCGIQPYRIGFSLQLSKGDVTKSLLAPLLSDVALSPSYVSTKLHLLVVGEPSHISLQFLYGVSLFPRNEIDEMADKYLRLIDSADAFSSLTVGELIQSVTRTS